VHRDGLLSILVVEDDVAIREGLSTLLRTNGFQVRTAIDGQEALDLLLNGLRPNLLLIDLALPKVSGWDLLRYMHEDLELRGIPAIIVTAETKEHSAAIADEVFIKPVDAVRLLDSVKRLAR
jgi:CheY-like chemotaxis protein